MSNINTAITIWWKAIIFNALFTSTWTVFEAGVGVIVLTILMVVFGFVISLPLLPFVSALLALQQKLPYGKKERLAWLCCILVILVWGFYGITVFVIDKGWPSNDTLFYYISITTSMAVLTAVYFTRKDILSAPDAPIGHAISNNKQITHV